MGRYTTLPELKRTSPPLEGEPSVRPQRYTTNPIKVGGGGSFPPPKPVHLPSSARRKAPPNTERSKRLHSKIAPSRGVTKNLSQGELKRTSTSHRSEQYWSRLRPVLVTTTDQYWSHRRPVLVDFLLPHRIPRVQLIPMQLSTLELW